MGFLKCFNRSAQSRPLSPSSAPAIEAPPDRAPAPSSTAKGKVVRAPPAGQQTQAAKGFVPRSVAELHPEYSHSEPYHFAANTASARLVVDSASRAKRRTGDLRLRAADVPSPKKVVVRGPSYRVAAAAPPPPADASRKSSAALPRAPSAKSTPRGIGAANSARKSSVELIVESPATYRRDSGAQVQDENDVAAANPPASPQASNSSRGLSRFMKRGLSPLRSPRGKSPAQSPLRKKIEDAKLPASSPPAEKAAVQAQRTLSFNDEVEADDVEADGVEAAPRPPSYMDGFDQAAAKMKAEEEGRWEEQAGYGDAESEEEEDDDEAEHGNAEEEEQSEEEESEEEQEYAHEQESEAGASSYRSARDEDHSDDEASASDGEASSTQSQGMYYRQYPDANREGEIDAQEESASDSESEDGSDNAVSANGFLTEDHHATNASATASARSSIRSSIRSSTRSAAMDTYSVDSDYVHSTDGDRVQTTFAFMRDSARTDTTVDTTTTDAMSEAGPPAARYGDRDDQDASFASASSGQVSTVREGSTLSEVHSSRGGGNDQFADAPDSFTRVPSAAPRRSQRRDSTIAVRKVEAYAAAVAAASPRARKPARAPPSPHPSQPRRTPARISPGPDDNRYADYSDSEGGSLPSASLVPIARAGGKKAPARKTVSFRVDKEVLIEPNLRDRRHQPSTSLPRGIGSGRKLVSVLKKQSSLPRDADRPIVRESARDTSPMKKTQAIAEPIVSPRNSFSGMDPNASFLSASSSFDSLPGRRGSARLDPEMNRRRSMAVADAMTKQIQGVPKSAMLAYAEHEPEEEEGEYGVGSRGSLRPRARSGRSIRLPPVITPGVVPPPPPPPPFEPEPLRVRSVRVAPAPPTAHVERKEEEKGAGQRKVKKSSKSPKGSKGSKSSKSSKSTKSPKSSKRSKSPMSPKRTSGRMYQPCSP